MNLADQNWRLANLYKCKKEGSGEAVPFRMRPEQQAVIESLQQDPLTPVYIIKARRLGLSTGLGIYTTDHCTWNGGAVGRLIERTKDFAGEKMRDIMRFAFNSMPAMLTERFDVKHGDSPAILDPKVIGCPEDLRSGIHAGVASRGGDCAILWVSEWGPIAHKDPKRSEEIKTGAFPSARLGRRVVETTWMGGKSGDLWDLVSPIMKSDPDAAGKIMFFPWHGDPACVRMDAGEIGREHEDYFRTLAERTGKTFSREQKRWFVVTRKEQGIFMKREFPSTLDEAFSAPVEGAIYASELGIAEADGRITRLPVDGGLVHTFWDLGAPKNTRVWYVQQAGRFLRVLRCDRGTDETITQRWARMLGYQYNFGTHFLPHDAGSTARNGVSFADECRQLGMNIKVVPPCADLWVGINHLKGLFASLEFDAEKCRDGLDALACYHIGPDNEPVHDSASHDADGLRTMAEAHLHNLFKFTWADTSSAPEYSAVRRRERRIAPVRIGG